MCGVIQVLTLHYEKLTTFRVTIWKMQMTEAEQNMNSVSVSVEVEPLETVVLRHSSRLTL